MKDNNIYKLNQIYVNLPIQEHFIFIEFKLGREKPSIIIKGVNTNEKVTDKDVTELFANFFLPIYSLNDGKIPIL